MVNNKIQTYVGFCIKAGKVTYGIESISRLKKGVHLILLCQSAAKNTCKEAYRMQEVLKCPLLICKEPLAELVHKQGCKVIALKDASLAKAILANLDQTFEYYIGGNNDTWQNMRISKTSAN